MIYPHPCHVAIDVGLGEITQVATLLVKSDRVGADVASWQLCVDGHLVLSQVKNAGDFEVVLSIGTTDGLVLWADHVFL